jgi:hypothetical protein
MATTTTVATNHRRNAGSCPVLTSHVGAFYLVESQSTAPSVFFFFFFVCAAFDFVGYSAYSEAERSHARAIMHDGPLHFRLVPCATYRLHTRSYQVLLLYSIHGINDG